MYRRAPSSTVEISSSFLIAFPKMRQGCGNLFYTAYTVLARVCRASRVESSRVATEENLRHRSRDHRDDPRPLLYVICKNASTGACACAMCRLKSASMDRAAVIYIKIKTTSVLHTERRVDVSEKKNKKSRGERKII